MENKDNLLVPTGGRRTGGGRPVGTKNELTKKAESTIAFAIGKFKGTAREFLQMCMENQDLSPSMRMDAAKTLIQYEEAKLSNVTVQEKRTVERDAARDEIVGLTTEQLANIVKLGEPVTTNGRPSVAAKAERQKLIDAVEAATAAAKAKAA